jgi:threonine dehydrogenase-like Zn-dependent dehydrogenase
MRAVVTERVGSMRLRERPAPGDPPPGEVLVRPEAVGICGSDYHLYEGDLSAAAGGDRLPRIQGHEVGARIAALGDGCRAELEVGQRVALLPLRACGHCPPCRAGRPNACNNFQLIGVHVDGGLQDLLTLAEDQVFPVDGADAVLAALVEPISIAMRAVRRARIAAGERAVVMGAGPIGQGIVMCARERGAEVLVVDPQPARLELSRALGAETLPWTTAAEVVALAREWGGPDGPPVALDATGVPAAVRAMVDLVASAGRAAQVGMSNAEVSLRIGSLTEKELDLLGVTCCDGEDFAAAVALVERRPDDVTRLVSHEFPLEQAHDAMRFAIEHPTEVMKVMIRVDGHG